MDFPDTRWKQTGRHKPSDRFSMLHVFASSRVALGSRSKLAMIQENIQNIQESTAMIQSLSTLDAYSTDPIFCYTYCYKYPLYLTEYIRYLPPLNGPSRMRQPAADVATGRQNQMANRGSNMFKVKLWLRLNNHWSTSSRKSLQHIIIVIMSPYSLLLTKEGCRTSGFVSFPRLYDLYGRPYSS